MDVPVVAADIERVDERGRRGPWPALVLTLAVAIAWTVIYQTSVSAVSWGPPTAVEVAPPLEGDSPNRRPATDPAIGERFLGQWTDFATGRIGSLPWASVAALSAAIEERDALRGLGYHMVRAPSCTVVVTVVVCSTVAGDNLLAVLGEGSTIDTYRLTIDSDGTIRSVELHRELPAAVSAFSAWVEDRYPDLHAPGGACNDVVPTDECAAHHVDLARMWIASGRPPAPASPAG